MYIPVPHSQHTHNTQILRMSKINLKIVNVCIVGKSSGNILRKCFHIIQRFYFLEEEESPQRLKYYLKICVADRSDRSKTK